MSWKNDSKCKHTKTRVVNTTVKKTYNSVDPDIIYITIIERVVCLDCGHKEDYISKYAAKAITRL